jgi:hypothetical protein
MRLRIKIKRFWVLAGGGIRRAGPSLRTGRQMRAKLLILRWQLSLLRRKKLFAASRIFLRALPPLLFLLMLL